MLLLHFSCDTLRNCISTEHDSVSHTVTLEEAEYLTSSTLSDSTQMTLSNISSQPMSVSIHSEVSNMSEAEKHELEDTIESDTEEYAKGFEENPDYGAISDEEVILLDEKCVAELKVSEKHVKFPQVDTTTDVLYTNEQLSQSAEGVIDISDTEHSDVASPLAFAHCAVDELSRGRPKEKLSEEVKELSSMTSSAVTDEGGYGQAFSSDISPDFESPESERSTTPTRQPKTIRHVSFDDGLPEDYSSLITEKPCLDHTASLGVEPPSESHSIHSEEHVGRSASELEERLHHDFTDDEGPILYSSHSDEAVVAEDSPTALKTELQIEPSNDPCSPHVSGPPKGTVSLVLTNNFF